MLVFTNYLPSQYLIYFILLPFYGIQEGKEFVADQVDSSAKTRGQQKELESVSQDIDSPSKLSRKSTMATTVEV